MKRWIKEVIGYTIVVAAIMAPLFLKPGYVFFTDFVSGPKVRLDFFQPNFLGDFLIKLCSFFYAFGFGQKLFMALVLVLLLLGSRKICQQVSANPLVVFLSSLFFLFNPFIYDRLMYGQIGIVAALGCLCFAFGYLLEYLQKKQLRQISLAGIFGALAVQFSPPFMFFFGIVVLVFIILSVQEKEGIVKILRNALFIFALVFLLNINWIAGALLHPHGGLISFINQGVTQQDLVAFKTSGKTGLDALRYVFMMSGFWGKDQGRYADLTLQNSNWGRSFLVLLPLIAWGALAALRKKETRFFIIALTGMFLVAVLLAVGVRLPVSREITYWLFNHLGAYRGMRETQKWVSLVVVVYGLCLAFGLEKLFATRITQKNKVVISILVTLVILMQAPFLLWGFAGQVKAADYPSDWTGANTIIAQSGCRGNILFLPWHMYMYFGFAGRVISVPARDFFSCPVVQGTNVEWGGIYDNSNNPAGRTMVQWLTEKSDISFLQKNGLNVSYIIIAKEADWRNYQWIGDLPGVTLVKDTDALMLYNISH